MVASEDKNIRFFQIDGDKNEKIMSESYTFMNLTFRYFLWYKSLPLTLHLSILALVLCGLTGVRFNEMSIDSAAFLGNGTEVVVGGRKPFFFSYDTTSGAISKIPGESAAANST